MNNYLLGVNLSTSTATFRYEELQIYSWLVDGKEHRLDEPAYISKKDKRYEW